MNDERWMQVVAEKDQEIDALRDILRRLKDLVGKGRTCCYCGTDNPHAKACEEAMGMLEKGKEK